MAIDAFPEKALFSHSIGGMRPFSEMVVELLSIAAPGIEEITSGVTVSFEEKIEHEGKKEKLLELWDETTKRLDRLFPKIQVGDFQKEHLAFGQYPGTVRSAILYFIDNEIHHRGQAFVYLRSLGIEPPLFYDRVQE